jgi:enoyl-CoA hydratase
MLTIKEEGSLLVVTIERPKALNAINREVMDGLGKLFIEDAASTSAYRAIIITGSGPKAFAAGADIAEFPQFGVEEGTSLSAKGHQVYQAIESFQVPVIAAINGFALGGGCELAMACHMRIAEEQAKLGQPEINLGLIPGYGGTQRLVRYIGRAKAIELLLTGDMISAQEAKALGLVNQVVPIGESLSHARALGEKIAKKSSVVISKMLEAVYTYHQHETPYDVEVKAFGACFGLEDMKEGVDAFLNKRKPDFKGK